MVSVHLNKGTLHRDITHLLVCMRWAPVSALVTVTHKFWQYLPTKLPQATYVFPVPARAAVCGFEMTGASGAVIVAVVKEKEEARREYETAIRHGRTAGLLEHVTDDSQCSPSTMRFLITDMMSSIFAIPWGSSSTPDIDNQSDCK